MIKIVHRVNTIKELSSIPSQYGVEVDIRAHGSNLVLNHEPYTGGDLLEEYLGMYRHACIVFNVKEAGIEADIIRLAQVYGVGDYFLLDVEFPYLYRAARSNIKKVAIRYSEDECIDLAKKYTGRVDWVWIDTNTKMPLDKEAIRVLSPFRTCLVSPDRWGRPYDIEKYQQKLHVLNFIPTAVMVGRQYADLWTL